MELRGIRRLLAIADCGSFSAAAIKLNISQPALTRSIQQLEADYGVQLVERTPYGVRLTRIGRELEPMFRQFLSSRDAIRFELRRHQAEAQSSAAFGVCASYEGAVLPSLLAALDHRRPRVNLHVHSGVTSGLIKKVLVRDIEFALGLDVNGAQLRQPELVFEKICDDRLVVVARADHPLARRSRVPADELASVHWLRPWLADYAVPAMRKIFLNHVSSASRHVVNLDSNALARKTALLGSDFITVLSELGVRDEVDRGEMAVIDVVDFDVPVKVGFFRAPDGSMSEPATWAHDVLRQAIRKLGRKKKAA